MSLKFAIKRALGQTIHDLRKIEARSLPSNQQFSERRAAAEAVEGMFSIFSMAVMDMMLCTQEGFGAKGDILEIGTYRGKSAALLGRHLRADERLTLADINDYLDPSAVAPFRDKVEFILTGGEKLGDHLSSSRRFRFVHIDAGHGYEETYQELEMADRFLAPLGIIAMDDFTNLHYSQNMVAIFRYLFTAPTNLTIFLVTDAKAYLCRREDLNRYTNAVMEASLAELKSRGVDPVLARTAMRDDYKAAYLRERVSSDDAPFYGESVYRNQLMGLY